MNIERTRAVTEQGLRDIKSALTQGVEDAVRLRSRFDKKPRDAKPASDAEVAAADCCVLRCRESSP